MKIGLRIPNLKKSLKARTTGKLKMQMKKLLYLDMARRVRD
ncbi:hypothetical protein [Clostridium estertheticum]|nr:hypothetical protein [Clostridium estertheticum]